MHCSTAFGTHFVVLRCPCYERRGGHDGEAMRGQRGARQLWGGSGCAIRMLILGIGQPPIIGFVQNNIHPPTKEAVWGEKYLHRVRLSVEREARIRGFIYLFSAKE